MENKAQPIINDLNTRQWELIKFLEQQNEYLKRDEILEKSGIYDNPFRPLRINGKYNVSASRLLTHDLQKIKESLRYNKIIITDRKGIKIAQTDEEVIDYFNREKKEILKRLSRYYLQANEYRNNGQYRAVFGKEKDIEEALNIKELEELKQCIG